MQVKEELCYGSARCPKALSRLCRAAENISGTSPIAYGLAFLFSSVSEILVLRSCVICCHDSMLFSIGAVVRKYKVAIFCH